MEHGKVEGKTKSDWVAGVQACGSFLSELVVLKGTGLDNLELVSVCALGNVSVVVTHHLVEESFGLVGGSDLHAGLLDGFDDLDALVVQLLVDPLLVISKDGHELGVLWVLLDGGDGPDGSSL